MTRDNYILAVKAKLDEISPFDEPQSFIAADGDTDYDEVKPIVSYIDSSLDEAARYCLSDLPLSLLAQDISKDEIEVSVNKRGVGTSTISNIDNYRWVRVHDPNEIWERDVTAFYTTSHPMYLLQQNMHTRGGCSKPVVVLAPETNGLELYSFPIADTTYTIKVEGYMVDTSTSIESILSSIERFIVLRCASYVEEILGDANAAKIFNDEYELHKSKSL